MCTTCIGSRTSEHKIQPTRSNSRIQIFIHDRLKSANCNPELRRLGPIEANRQIHVSWRTKSELYFVLGGVSLLVMHATAPKDLVTNGAASMRLCD